MSKENTPLSQQSPTLNSGDEASPGTVGTGEDYCQVCGGDGKKDGKPCENCGGTGKVVEGIGGG